MKATELRQKTKKELETMLNELAREKFNLKMQKATGQLSKPHQIKNVRRDVARIQTIMKEMSGTQS